MALPWPEGLAQYGQTSRTFATQSGSSTAQVSPSTLNGSSGFARVENRTKASLAVTIPLRIGPLYLIPSESTATSGSQLLFLFIVPPPSHPTGNATAKPDRNAPRSRTPLPPAKPAEPPQRAPPPPRSCLPKPVPQPPEPEHPRPEAEAPAFSENNCKHS